MAVTYQPNDVGYYPFIADAGVNWATPLDVIAVASEESGKRGVVPFSFISDVRGINAYFKELKLADEERGHRNKLFSERMIFESNGKGYPISREVSSALSSEFLRRIENHDNKPSYYLVSSQIRYRLSDLAIATRELVVPAGIGFCDRFGCNRDGKLLYRKDI